MSQPVQVIRYSQRHSYRLSQKNSKIKEAMEIVGSVLFLLELFAVLYLLLCL